MMRMTTEIATAFYIAGIHPLTEEEVYVARGLRERTVQRALMRFLKRENRFMVPESLVKARRPYRPRVRRPDLGTADQGRH
jgi:hypothetical protein